MGITLIISGFAIPLLFWAAYHYYHDRHRPEPVLNLVVALLLGAGASLLAGLGYDLTAELGLRPELAALTTEDPLGLLIYCIVGIGLLEETAKLLPFIVVVMRFADFDEPLDGIVYASFIGLGFALAESVHFVNHVTLLESIARGFAGPVVHIAFASLWGYHLAVATHNNSNLVRPTLMWLTLAAFAHGLYDFVVLAFADVALLLAAAIIVFIWLWRLRVIVRLDGNQQA